MLGKVSNNPSKHYRNLKPMVNYVAERMADLGVKEGKVLMAKDDQHMLQLLKSGQVDWVTETLMATALYQHYAMAEPLVKKWKKGVPSYSAIIATRKDSGLNSLDALMGKRIAFEDPGSTSAYFLPAYALLKNGLQLNKLDHLHGPVGRDKVSYIFSQQEINSATWLHKGLVDAAAFSNLDWQNEGHVPRKMREDMQIIFRSEPLPRALESVNPQLREDRKQRLKTILLEAHANADAKGALRAYQKTSRFSALSAEDLAHLNNAPQMIYSVNRGAPP